MNLKYFFGIFMYKLAKNMPVSYSKIKIGQKAIRALCASLIMTSSGKCINIEKGAVFSKKCKIGSNSGIGVNCIINGDCTIGNDVMMGPNCIIYTINHEYSKIDVPMNQQGETKENPVFIGNDVWIGSNVIILPGVRIGNHSIIGAGSVVSKNIPEYAIACGNPCIVKKYRNSK